MADKPAFNPKAGYDAAKPAFDPNAKTDGIDIPDANAQAHQAILNTPMSQSQLGESATSTPTAANIIEATTPAAFAAKHPIQAAAAIPGAILGAAAAPAGIGGAALVGGAGAGIGTQVKQVLSGENPLTPQALQETGQNTAVGSTVGAAGASISPIAKWLTASKSNGATLLNAAAQKAANQPVELSPETNKIVEQIVAQGKRGNGNVKVITDLMARLGNNPNAPPGANEGPLLYPEARDFQSNASRLSASESMDAKGSLKALMAQFSKSFGRDVQTAADEAGAGMQHRMGMQEYASASGRNQAAKTAVKVGVPTLGAVAGVYELLKKFGVKVP